MPNDNKKADLGFLGEPFQYKLVHEFLENSEFFEELSVIVDQNVFTDPTLRRIVGVMKNYLDNVGVPPKYDMVEIELRKDANSERECETYLATLQKIRNVDSSGSDRIKELAIKFFRQQNIVKAANEILRIAGDGDTSKYDACVSILNDAMTKGLHNDLGESPFNHLEETLSDDYREPIPTGIQAIDEVLEGGLGKGELGVIIGPSGFGKAQPLNANILTPNGYKKMGEMHVGDLVMGCDGKPHLVSGVFPQGMRPIYKVTLSNGASCECDIEHLWNVNSMNQRDKKTRVGSGKRIHTPDRSFKTITLREIMEEGIMKRGELNFKLPLPKPMEFEKKDLLVDPYVIGYFIGDGCISRKNITVGNSDYEDVSKNFSSILKKESVHHHYIGKRNMWEFSFVSKLRNDLKEIFHNSTLSHEKSIPNDYLFSSIEDRISLLQGLMDSDGYASKNGYADFSSKSKTLAEQVCFLVRSLGGFATLREKNVSYFNKKYDKKIDCGTHYLVHISVNSDYPFQLFRLKRKQERLKERTLYKTNLYIKDVEYVREDEAQCIMVDSDEHLYITDDFIVTHNTSLTTAMASFASTYKCAQNAYQGYKVLQIVFEDRIKQIQRKHIGRITKIESKDLSKKEFIGDVKQALNDFQDKDMMDRNLRIVKFASGEKTAKSIGRFIKNLTNSGFKPDLVIVDYFECLAHEADKSATNEWEKEGKTMRVFEAMVGELNIAMWIPSQGTKDSINLEYVTMDKIGGSVKKAQIAHIIMSIARSMEDVENNKATIAILKNRAGKSGKLFNNVYFNNGTCTIDTTDCDAVDSMYEAKKKKDDETFKTQRRVFEMMGQKAKDP